jgi:hypothetical protein
VAIALLDELEPPRPALLLAGAVHAVRPRIDGAVLEVGPCEADDDAMQAALSEAARAASRPG